MSTEDRRFLRLVRLLDALFTYATPAGIVVIVGAALFALFVRR